MQKQETTTAADEILLSKEERSNAKRVFDFSLLLCSGEMHCSAVTSWNVFTSLL